MAILFTLPHRGNRITLPIFAVLNAFMLIGIPYCGDHYLSDMLAGVGIAILSFVIAEQSYRRIIAHLHFQSRVSSTTD
jgi:membrane-associated phospholipid phosphatase